MLSEKAPMTLSELLGSLDISPSEAETLLREAKIPPGREELTAPDLARVDTALARICSRLPGKDYRRADGADRAGSAEVGSYDLFHRKTGEHLALKTFGELLRWSESTYGWT